MTQYELLKATESILATLESSGVDAKDVKYLSMYDEYKRLKDEGHKISYIAYYLAQQHECGEATVYRVIKRMEKNLT